MPSTIAQSHAVFVLPPVMHSGALSDADRRWLSRGKFGRMTAGDDLFEQVLTVLGIDAPVTGRAALRLWGQTGDRPTVWIAAAEPVHLEARLDHVFLHSFRPDDLPLADLRDVFDQLHRSLGANASTAFARVGRYAYLRGEQPMATASCPSERAKGRLPNERMPQGPDAASHDRLLGEVQMSLHDAEVNQRRAAAGLLPVNSIWMWGGGVAPPASAARIPPLFSNDPQLRGYWYSRLGVTQRWSGDFEGFPELALSGFVAVCPSRGRHASDTALRDYLAQLRRFYEDGRMRRMTLLFRDGLKVEIGVYDWLRFWRGVSAQFQPAAGA